MFNRNELKRTAKFNNHKNFPEVTIIQIFNYFIPIIIAFILFGKAGIAIASNNILLSQEYLPYVTATFSIQYMFYDLIITFVFPMFITYWSNTYYAHVHVNQGIKVSPFSVINKLSITGLIRYSLKIFATNCLVALWSLLLIIPGFIKAYSYYLVPFIAVDQPELGIRDTINLSKKLMDGNKMGVFVLNCSFLLWTIAVAFTSGILGFYVYPYIALTDMALYFELMYPPKTYSNEYIDLSIYGPQAPLDE